MAQQLVIWGGQTNPNSYKSLITAKYVGVDVKLGENFKMGETNKTPEYIAKHPLGQVPMMDTPQGPLFESNSLARYVARVGSNNQIYGDSPYATTQIDSWLDLARSVEPNITGWFYPLMGRVEFNAAAVADSKKKAERYLAAINQHLTNKTFLLGDHVTLADICLFCCLINPMKNLLGPELRETYKSLTEWWLRCSNEPHFKSVTGDIVLCAAEPTEPIKRERNN